MWKVNCRLLHVADCKRGEYNYTSHKIKYDVLLHVNRALLLAVRGGVSNVQEKGHLWSYNHNLW